MILLNCSFVLNLDDALQSALHNQHSSSSQFARYKGDWIVPCRVDSPLIFIFIDFILSFYPNNT
jgi:hypothetical protein